MDNQTAVVIDKLADKLGTTSEYLWAVLIKQAPISGTIDLIMYAITVVAVVVCWKKRVAISSLVQGAIDSRHDSVSFVGFIGSIVLSLLVVVWLGACLFSISNVVTAFVNPEYWALDKVLNTLKSK